MTDRNKLLATQLALVLGVCYFFFFFGLGAFGLTGADEPRYAQIAREMLARHDWIVPTLNGSPWLEKPALLYWKIMNSYAIFGVSDWAARIPAAAHATAVVFGIFFFMRRFRFGSELDAAMIAASSAGMIGFGRGASTDMLVSAPFALAMMCWWTWRQTNKKLWLLMFYGLLGVGALAKGPVAPALAVLIVGAYAVLRRDGKIFLRSLSVIGFALFAAIVLPWYLAVQHKVPQFFRVFFIEHNLERFGTNLYQHSQPFWYYIPVFLLAAMPWTLFAVPALIDAGRNAWKRWRSSARPTDPESIIIEAETDDGLPSFLFIWIVVPIALFQYFPRQAARIHPASDSCGCSAHRRLCAPSQGHSTLADFFPRVALRGFDGGSADGSIRHDESAASFLYGNFHGSHRRSHCVHGPADGPP